VTEEPNQIRVELKDPVLAAFLAWLVPGLGHFYQGRLAKGFLFLITILGTFITGVYLGGSSELGWGRVVYASWREGDKRPHFFAQLGVGLPSMPALVQASRLHNQKAPLLNGFMAPPALDGQEQAGQPTLSRLNKELHHFFELGTMYTMVAGLLNILAIYDAFGGPVIVEPRPRKREDEEEEPPADAKKPLPQPTTDTPGATS
jgi:hypothetical protein